MWFIVYVPVDEVRTGNQRLPMLGDTLALMNTLQRKPTEYFNQHFFYEVVNVTNLGKPSAIMAFLNYLAIQLQGIHGGQGRLLVLGFFFFLASRVLLSQALFVTLFLFTIGFNSLEGLYIYYSNLLGELWCIIKKKEYNFLNAL